MPLYEVMFIVQPELEGDLLEESVNRVTDVIQKEGGEIVSVKKLGKKKLAYEINDFREGSYFLIHTRCGKELIPNLDHFFKVNEGYLRYIIIRLNEEKDSQEKSSQKPQKENSTVIQEDSEEVQTS